MEPDLCSLGKVIGGGLPLAAVAGRRDVLELGRRTRPQPYGMRGTFRPLIEREFLQVRLKQRTSVRLQRVKQPVAPSDAR